MNPLGLTRLIIYVLVISISLSVLGLSAHIASFGSNHTGGYDNFAAFAIAVSVLTLLTLIPVLIMDHVRENFMLSWTMVELGWLGVLWILWLASAATTTAALEPLNTGCSSSSLLLYILAIVAKISLSEATSVCHQLHAIEGLSWVIWILLSIVLVYILIFAIRAHSAGHHGIWRASAAHMSGSVPSASSSAYPMSKHQQPYSTGGATVV